MLLFSQECSALLSILLSSRSSFFCIDLQTSFDRLVTLAQLSHTFLSLYFRLLMLVAMWLSSDGINSHVLASGGKTLVSLVDNFKLTTIYFPSHLQMVFWYIYIIYIYIYIYIIYIYIYIYIIYIYIYILCMFFGWSFSSLYYCENISSGMSYCL